MRDEDECLTDNSLFNHCVACKDCMLRAKTYKDGRPIPEDRRYKCGFCQVYLDKPTEVYFYEADCKYKTKG